MRSSRLWTAGEPQEPRTDLLGIPDPLLPRPGQDPLRNRLPRDRRARLHRPAALPQARVRDGRGARLRDLADQQGLPRGARRPRQGPPEDLRRAPGGSERRRRGDRQGQLGGRRLRANAEPAGAARAQPLRPLVLQADAVADPRRRHARVPALARQPRARGVADRVAAALAPGQPTKTEEVA